jgi:hypothetical protein
MSKYIDAERLKAQIKEIENEFKTGNYYLDNSEQAVGYYNALMDFENLVFSLQQEQSSEDLDADIEMEWDSFNKHLAEYGKESEEVVWLDWYGFNDVARYFYGLGLNARKED